MRTRYYSPAQGRFLSRDPIGFAGGINPYAYCYGDPINYSDADGTLAGPPIYTELPYVSEIVGSGELGATGGAAAGGATIGAGGVITLCAADFTVFYCAFHPLGVMIAKYLFPMDDIGCGPAEMAANPREAERRKTIDRCHHPETIMRLVGDEEANKIRMTRGFVPIERWNYTRVFFPKDLPKMLMHKMFKDRNYLVTAKVENGWRSTILISDGWGLAVGTPEINGYLIGTPSVVPLGR